MSDLIILIKKCYMFTDSDGATYFIKRKAGQMSTLTSYVSDIKCLNSFYA